MATRMALWRIQHDGTAQPVGERQLEAEEIIESAVESAPELLGVDVLIIGRQTMTPSGPLDLLGINADAQLVVVENKRDRTPREVLAQTIDYAAWVNTLTFGEVAAIYADYRTKNGDEAADLAEAFEEHFGEQLDAINGAPSMIIVASRLDDSTERMIDFLADTFAVPVNAVLFQPFEGGLIGRTWLRPDESRPVASGKRAASTLASREESKAFWDRWLPIGRGVLHDIRLPKSGPRSVLIKRRIVMGVPAALTVWVSKSEAYAEVQFDDDEPSLNAALLEALKLQRTAIEQAFGSPLEWRAHDAAELLTKRTKVVAPKVAIGERTDPTDDGMQALAASARRLVDAVKPHLTDALELAAGQTEETSTDTDPVDTGLVPGSSGAVGRQG